MTQSKKKFTALNVVVFVIAGGLAFFILCAGAWVLGRPEQYHDPATGLVAMGVGALALAFIGGKATRRI